MLLKTRGRCTVSSIYEYCGHFHSYFSLHSDLLHVNQAHLNSGFASRNSERAAKLCHDETLGAHSMGTVAIVSWIWKPHLRRPPWERYGYAVAP